MFPIGSNPSFHFDLNSTEKVSTSSMDLTLKFLTGRLGLDEAKSKF